MSDEIQQLTAIRGQAFFTSTAQKLDMNIKKFNQNPNTQIRWIWQLIQNAKDAPNKFGKVKIKQQLTNNAFISSHNGDAFNLKQLHSVATQYSTKQQKNSQNVKTTGKYGTGFITTHIISRKVRLSSILKYQKKKKEDSQSQMDQQNVQLKQTSQKVQLKQTSQQLQVKQTQQKVQVKQKSQQVQTQQKIQIQNSIQKYLNIQNQKSCINQQKSSENIQRTFYYKKFDLKLDRSYNDRDEQLSKKIKKTQKNLTEIVLEAKIITVNGINKQLINYYENNRNEDSFDTSFTYQLKDDSKFGIIENAVKNVRALVSYALLFNENFYEYEFIDKRSNLDNNSFAFKRESFIRMKKNIYLFKYNFLTSYDIQTSKFKENTSGYILAISTNETVVAGIPLKVDGEVNWSILKVDQTLPQIFKDFPLIGSTCINWNAVINSNKFYPNQERSSLILNSIDEGSADKVQTNKENLMTCFQGVKDLYIFLAQYDCQQGLSNLLIFNHNNGLTYLYPNLKNSLEIHIAEIMDTKFIPIIRGQDRGKSKPKELYFISQITYYSNQKVRRQMSKQISEVFRFLYPENNLLSGNLYFEFYDVIESHGINKGYLKSQIKIINLNDCLKTMESNGLTKFSQIFKQQSFDKLHEIYSTLTKYDIQVWKYCIYLNDNKIFKKLDKTDELMRNYMSIYQEKLLDQLNIQFKDRFIHRQFAKHFTKVLANRGFYQKHLQQLIQNEFIQLKYDERQSLNGIKKIEKKLELLYRLLFSFHKFPQDSSKRLRNMLIFNKNRSFTFLLESNINSLLNFSDNFFQKITQSFKFYLECYFHNQVKSKPTIEDFSKNFFVNTINNAPEYLKDLFQDKIFGQKLLKIPIKLSLCGKFTEENKLHKLGQTIELPNQDDIQIYNILSNVNRINNSNLKQKILLKIYPESSTQKIRRITYKQIFQNLIPNYNQISPQKKKRILHYLKKINDSFTKSFCVDHTIAEKHNAWKNMIAKRHVQMFQLQNQKGSFNKEEVKQFLFQLFNNNEQIEKEAQDYFKRKRTDQQNASNSSKNCSQPIKRTKLQ